MAPVRHRASVTVVVDRIGETLERWLIAQMITMFAVFLVTWIGLALIGVAPDQWLAVERGTERHRLNALRDSLAGLAAISEQGAGKVILEISGSHARDALCKGIAVDLHPAAFTVGSSARTVAAHIGVQVSLLDDAPTFELISAGSTAASLWSWLAQSAREFGLLVA